MTEAEQIMKRCQAGTRNYEEANNLHAACYGMIGKLLAQRTWVGLTAGEILDTLISVDEKTVRLPSMLGQFACAIEAKLKEKNNG